jgi:uncharacterized integral membrane protein
MVLAAAFAFANRFERVGLNLGIVRIGSLPLPLVFFAAVLLGMVAMLLLSLPQDRRTREALRERGLLDPAPAPPAAKPAPPAEPVTEQY